MEGRGHWWKEGSLLEEGGVTGGGKGSLVEGGFTGGRRVNRRKEGSRGKQR